MTTPQAMFVFIVGFIMTLGAAGGIELSETSEAMMDSMLFCIIGLLTMFCGVVGLNRAVLFD